MNGANVVMSSHYRARETLQNDAESSARDIKGAGLEPDTIRVRHPKTLIFQVEVSNEVFAAPSIWIEAVGETVEGSDWHLSSSYYCVSASVVTRSGLDYLFSEGADAAADAGRSEFQIAATTFHVPSAGFS